MLFSQHFSPHLVILPKIFLCLSQHNTLQVHPCCYKWQNSVLFMAEQYPIVYMYHSFFIHLSIDGHLRKVLQGIVMRWELGHSGESERLLGSCQHHEPYNQKSGQVLSVNCFYPCLGICLKKILIKKDTCTPIFTAALFTSAKIWKHLITVRCTMLPSYYNALQNLANLMLTWIINFLT